MLAKKYRLPIQHFYKKPGKAVKNSFFLVKSSVSNELFSMFGVAVGTKVHKLAVRRNALRRAAYRYIQTNGLYRRPGKNVMITVLPPAKELSKKEFKVALEELFLKIFD